MERYQVVVVGGGPVGTALAIDLGMRGIRCAVIERRHDPQRIPKGQNLTHRSLEHFYNWGIAKELRAARVLPPGYPIGGITVYGNLMSDYWFPWSDAPAAAGSLSDFYFEQNERLPQYCTEAVLRRRLAEIPIVDTFYGWAGTGCEQSPDGVRVSIAEVEGPQTDVIEADYVVGCDGSHSTVRAAMGIDLGGENFDQRMILAVFRSRELHEALLRFPERTTYRVLHPDLRGYWQFIGRVDVGEEFFFHAPVPRDAALDTYDLRAHLERAAGRPFACEIDYVGFWDLRIAIAQDYRAGRAFVAGDAAHSHPPYGGFGLNAGFEDAVNLGWKLEAVLKGWARPDLLDTYTDERRSVFLRTAEDVIARGIEADRTFLDRHNPERDLTEFEQAWRDWGAAGGSRPPSYEQHYEGSPIVFGPPGALSGIQGEPMYRIRAGHHLAPRMLSNGRNVFGELGRGFTLLALGAEENAVAAFEAAASRLHVPLKVIRDSFAGDVTAYESRMVLVRPDQFVAWHGDKLELAAEQILQTAIGGRSG